MAKVKSFFKKIGLWFKNHAPSKRRIIQLYSALLHNANIKGFITGKIYTGSVKNVCTPGLNCYSCPGAAAACPLGALQDSLASTNKRLPFYILGIIGIWGLMLARTICGFLCPIGFGQELLHKIKTPKVKKSRYTRVFSYFKYVLLAVLVIAIPLIYHGVPAFCKYICPAGTFGGAGGLLANSNNSDFYYMLGYLFSWKFVLLVIFVVGSIFFYRFFCRFFCPLGAIYGFFNKIALLGVNLERDKCVDCGMCLQTCQMDIKHVGDHECISCGACIPVCPTKAISWKGSKIFLKGVDLSVQEETAAPALASFVAGGGTTVSQEVEDTTPINVTPQAVDVVLPEMLVASQEKAQERLSEEVEAPANISENGDKDGKADKKAKVLTPSQKIKKRNFWLQVAAWAVALVVLLSALLYYNVFDKEKSVTVYSVGDRLPDFVLDTYDSVGAYDKDGNRMETFSSMENKGTVMVINFWYTTCDPCVGELPYFEKVRQEFGDQIIMIAIHDVQIIDDVQTFLETVDESKNKDDWSQYGIIFAQDTEEYDCFEMLGGKSAFPITVVVDTDGKIAYYNPGTVEENELRSQIQSVLK